MALTGFGLIGFVVAHLLGNLQVFAGQEVFNAYAAFLKSLGPMLWVARLGLLAIFFLHVATAISLWRTNSAARPESYRRESTVRASAESLYMMQSGTVVLIFVIIHLLHFTLGKLQPEFYHLTDAQGRHDVYSMLVHGFLNKGYVLVYVVAMTMLGFHLRHAMSSMFQTLGITGPRLTPVIQGAAKGLSLAIVLGYISIPLAVQAGFIVLPLGGGF
jgi:succinate dehydrogenase / fumarate reductase cytochrome b subunit